MLTSYLRRLYADFLVRALLAGAALRTEGHAGHLLVDAVAILRHSRVSDSLHGTRSAFQRPASVWKLQQMRLDLFYSLRKPRPGRL